MEEPVLLTQEYSVVCDSLVQEDAQGRQESFDYSISAFWQQWGQMCL